ncbi:MAG: hypothetical protein K2N51_03540 [Lachnospiraceae bacterium]|nr:hypothetical protein [Lachnospiraceae bacterium]
MDALGGNLKSWQHYCNTQAILNGIADGGAEALIQMARDVPEVLDQGAKPRGNGQQTTFITNESEVGFDSVSFELIWDSND